jgi:hypothetical protein
VPVWILLVAILAVIALGVRSMLRAISDAFYGRIERQLDGEEIEIPDVEPENLWDWLHQRLVECYRAESEGWAVEQLARVDARLQAAVPREERLESVLLQIPEENAFAIPGQRVYVSRRLLERARGDEVVAFIVAHEFAHLQLGHLARGENLGEASPLAALTADLALVRHLMGNAAREEESDAHALNLCLAAGYDARRCLEAFDLLEMVALDHGDREGVFGSEAAMDALLDGEGEWRVRLHEWLTERRCGYPPLRERKARLLAVYDEAVAAAAKSSTEPAPA